MTLPPGWAEATVADLVRDPRDITDGPFGSNLKTAHYTAAGPRVIRLQNIGDGVFKNEQAHISPEHFETLRKHEVRAGDILVASLGEELPRACVAPEIGPAIVKADCIRIRPHPEVSSAYVAFALNSPAVRQATDIEIRGVGRPRINLSHLRALALPLPPRAEQARIAEEIERRFSRLDAGVRILDAARRKLTNTRSAIIQSAVPTTWPGHWKTVTVAAAGEARLGLQRSPSRHSGTNMRPYLRVANVFEARLDLGDVMEMHFTPPECERYRLLPGDVLLNEGQSPELLGRPALWSGQVNEMYFTNSLIRFRAGEGVLPEWALLVFRRHLHAGRFRKESRVTTNIAHLALGRFKTIEFPIPPLEEQVAVVAEVERRLSLLDAARRAVEANQRRGNTLRRAILRDAFAGRLVVQDPTDEPADEMLARVRAGQPVRARGRQPRVSAPMADEGTG